MKPVILLLSATSGYGHVQAGMGLARSIRKLMPDCEVRHENLCDYASFLQKWSIERLWQAASTWPLFRMIYGWLHRQVISSDRLGEYFSRLYRPVGDRLLERYAHTDVVGVVALHPGAACAAVWWKKQREFFLGVVATDLVVHSLQVLPGVDAVFADSRSVIASAMAAAREKAGDVISTGLPVSAAFFRIKNGNKTPDFRIVVSFGAKGLRAAWHLPVLIRLVSEQSSSTFTFVCGHDGRLRARVEALVRSHGLSERVRVVGFARNMPELLREADVLIGKAGGISVGEVLATRKPFLAIEVLPGQEEYNAEVLQAIGAGRIVRGYAQLAEGLESVRTGAWRLDASDQQANAGIPRLSMELVRQLQRRQLSPARQSSAHADLNRPRVLAAVGIGLSR